MGRNHEHTRGADVAEISGQRRRALWIALAANGGFLCVEFVGGVVFGSLALLADAVHMLSDVAALTIALVAQRLIDRPASVRHTFGLQRAEVLGAQANGVLLLASAGWILFEAVRRIGDPPAVAGGGVLIVATVGLLINVGSAVLLMRASGRSLNMRGAYSHMLADAVGSVGAIFAGLAIVLFTAYWVDAAVSLLIGLLVIVTAWRLLRDTAHVLLEGAPEHLDATRVEAWLARAPGVESVHHMHLWQLTSEATALSAHVVLDDEPSLHEAQARGDALKEGLATRFSIMHATLELECHDCEPTSASTADGAQPREVASD